MAELCLIQVPYILEGEHHGGSEGPARIVQSGVRELLAEEGVDVAIERVERGTPFRDSVSASFVVNQQLAAITVIISQQQGRKNNDANILAETI